MQSAALVYTRASMGWLHALYLPFAPRQCICPPRGRRGSSRHADPRVA